jgi:CAAX protease family protein
MKLRYLLYSLVPFAVLMISAAIASVLAYFLVLGVGEQFPFRKVVSRVAQVLLILSIFPFMSYLKLKKEDIGFAPRNVFLKQLLKGFVFGLLTLLPVLAMLFILDINIVDETKHWTLGILVKALSGALLAAISISLLEEPLFRGMMLTGLNKKMGATAAVIISSFYYAALHFMKGQTDIPYAQLNIFSGFYVIKEALANLFNPEIISALIALFMVGMVLGIMRCNIKQSLGLCIGCHASWVWQIKMTKQLFNTNPQSEYLYLISNYDGVVGPLVTGWLLMVIFVYYAVRRWATIH